MYPYSSNSLTRSSSMLSTASAENSVAMFIFFILAVIGGILIYFLFVRNKKDFGKFGNQVRDFLDFKNLLIDHILKIAYLIFTLAIIFTSLQLIATSFLTAVLTLVLGVIFLRGGFELSMILINLFRQVKEINQKLKK